MEDAGKAVLAQDKNNSLVTGDEAATIQLQKLLAGNDLEQATQHQLAIRNNAYGLGLPYPDMLRFPVGPAFFPPAQLAGGLPIWGLMGAPYQPPYAHNHPRNVIPAAPRMPNRRRQQRRRRRGGQ